MDEEKQLKCVQDKCEEEAIFGTRETIEHAPIYCRDCAKRMKRPLPDAEEEHDKNK